MAYNLVAKLVISDYTWFNLGMSSLVIGFCSLQLYALNGTKVLERLRSPMNFSCLVIGLLLFILAQFSLKKVIDNWLWLVIICTYGLQWIVYLLLLVITRIAIEHGNRQS